MAFFSRNFVLLWQGQLVSQLGNQAFLIATALFTIEATGSAVLVAAVMMASTLPLVIVGPIGGTMADRHSRRNLLVLTDLARAFTVGGLGLFLLWRPEAAPSHVALIIAVAAFGGAMGSVFSPAVQALIPELVPHDRLAAANSLNQISSQTSVLAGQALGGVLYVAWGAPVLLLLDAASFAYGAAATWLIPPDAAPHVAAAGIREAMSQYVVQTREGIVYVWRRSGMVAVLGTFAGVNFLFMPVVVLLPLYVRDALKAGPEWYGFLLAGSGAGALAGAAVAGALFSRVRAAALLVTGCVAGIGMSVLLLAAARRPEAALASFVAIGALSSAINVGILTTFQARLPSYVRGRVMALVIVLSTAAAPLGMAAGGVMGDLWRESLPAVFAGCGAAIVLLAVAASRVSGFSELLERQRSAESVP
jgi:MFS family permease